MIQARPSADEPAFGTFRLLPNDDKSQLFGCPDNGILVRTNASASVMIDDFIFCRILLLTEIPIQLNQ